jgi:ferredoxin
MDTLVTASHWALAQRYGKIPFRSPVNDTLAELLSTVFSANEAHLAAAFPVSPAPSSKIARRAGVADEDAALLLDAMDGRGVIGSYAVNGQRRYLLLPIVPGLFELVMWSRRTDARARRFAELSESYYDADYFTAKPKGIIKIIPVERHIDSQVGVLSSDRVSELVESHRRFSITVCCCRHSAELRNQPCSKPKEVCMAFGPLSDFLVDRNLARRTDKVEILETVQRAAEAGLVHLTDNVTRANFLCSCCSCCCTGLKIITRFSYPWMIAKSHFQVEVDRARCQTCGSCVHRCVTGALNLDGSELQLDDNRCIGCGVCVSGCKQNHALSLVERSPYRHPNASIGQLAADCGLQAIGPMRLVAERFPGAYQSLQQVVEKGIVRVLRGPSRK